MEAVTIQKRKYYFILKELLKYKEAESEKDGLVPGYIHREIEALKDEIKTLYP